MDNIYGFFLSLNFLSSAYNILLEEGLFRSLSLFGVLYSMECHIFLLYSVSWLSLSWACRKNIFSNNIYICVLKSFNVSTRMNSKLWKTGFVVNCTNFKGKHRKKIAAANKNSWDTTTYTTRFIFEDGFDCKSKFCQGYIQSIDVVLEKFQHF